MNFLLATFLAAISLLRDAARQPLLGFEHAAAPAPRTASKAAPAPVGPPLDTRVMTPAVGGDDEDDEEVKEEVPEPPDDEPEEEPQAGSTTVR